MMMYSATRILFALVACVSAVAAHGSVQTVVADGKTWPAPLPRSNANMNSPVREIGTMDPQYDVGSGVMACGPGAKPSARAVATVTAGSRIGFSWTSGGRMNWPHMYGPVMLYAYKCPGNASDCRPPTGKEWFLIDAASFDPDNNSSGPDGWIQNRFHQGRTVFANVPKGMQNGHFLFRHEIISMHIATGRGSEFYVSCTQVQIVGGVSTSAKAAGAEMVAHPGAYVGDSRLRQNVFDGNIRRTFRMPGPKKFTGAPGGGNHTATNTPRPTNTNSPRPGNTDAVNTTRNTNSPRPTNTDAINTTRNTNKPTSTGGSVINVAPSPTGTKKRCRGRGSQLVTRAADSDEIITIPSRHFRPRSSRL